MLSRYFLPFFSILFLLFQPVSATPPNKSRLLEIQSDDVYIGNKNAPNIMIEYSALTCPHCIEYHKTLFAQIKSDLIDKGIVKYVYRPLPNSGLALRAISLPHCQFAENKDANAYFTFVDNLVASYAQWTRTSNPEAVLMSVAKLNGMGEEAFKQCLQNDDMRDFIQNRARRDALDLGVNSIPTLIVNGQNVEHRSYEGVLKLLNPSARVTQNKK